MTALLNLLTEPSWQKALAPEFAKPYFANLEAEILERRHTGITIYPGQESIFAAFNLTPVESVKLVILGQDPYHGPGQAMGLSFSVPGGMKVPPSLRNIYKEIETDIGACTASTGDLTSWAEQGVLLLNTVLTVEDGKAHSHAKLGWEQLTDHAISALNEQRENIVFLLWGSHAQKKATLINAQKHKILAAPHPSPLSSYRGFFGCQHFSKANTYLAKTGQAEIVW